MGRSLQAISTHFSFNSGERALVFACMIVAEIWVLSLLLLPRNVTVDLIKGVGCVVVGVFLLPVTLLGLFLLVVLILVFSAGTRCQ